VVGAAIGFGAQTLVKDLISGLFIVFEDQYGVGDRVQLDGVTGLVERVGLRVTEVRDDKGVLWFIRNGEILKVGNFSQEKKKTTKRKAK
jgi:small conductance mechanosensitive channel